MAIFFRSRCSAFENSRAINFPRSDRCVNTPTSTGWGIQEKVASGLQSQAVYLYHNLYHSEPVYYVDVSIKNIYGKYVVYHHFLLG